MLCRFREDLFVLAHAVARRGVPVLSQRDITHF